MRVHLALLSYLRLQSAILAILSTVQCAEQYSIRTIYFSVRAKKFVYLFRIIKIVLSVSPGGCASRAQGAPCTVVTDCSRRHCRDLVYSRHLIVSVLHLHNKANTTYWTGIFTRRLEFVFLVFVVFLFCRFHVCTYLTLNTKHEQVL